MSCTNWCPCSYHPRYSETRRKLRFCATSREIPAGAVVQSGLGRSHENTGGSSSTTDPLVEESQLARDLGKIGGGVTLGGNLTPPYLAVVAKEPYPRG